MVTTLDRDIADRLRIDALMAEYAQCIDEDRLEEWPAFFTDDALYRVTTRENFDLDLPVCLIYCDGKGMLQDRISALRTANIFEPHVYCHTISASRITKRTPDEITVSSNFTIVRTVSGGDMSVFACGRYHDRLADTADGLRFRERTAVLDSRQIETLLVIPI